MTVVDPNYARLVIISAVTIAILGAMSLHVIIDVLAKKNRGNETDNSPTVIQEPQQKPDNIILDNGHNHNGKHNNGGNNDKALLKHMRDLKQQSDLETLVKKQGQISLERFGVRENKTGYQVSFSNESVAVSGFIPKNESKQIQIPCNVATTDPNAPCQTMPLAGQ